MLKRYLVDTHIFLMAAMTYLIGTILTILDPRMAEAFMAASGVGNRLALILGGPTLMVFVPSIVITGVYSYLRHIIKKQPFKWAKLLMWITWALPMFFAATGALVARGIL